MWKDSHCLLRTLNRSSWSFLDRPDIRQDFTVETLDPIGKEYQITEPSDGFLDVFMDFLIYIKICPGFQLSKFLDEYVKICNDLNKEWVVFSGGSRV
jgi:hypothetical protein